MKGTTKVVSRHLWTLNGVVLQSDFWTKVLHFLTLKTGILQNGTQVFGLLEICTQSVLSATGSRHMEMMTGPNIHGFLHRNNILLYKSQQDTHVTEFI